MRKIFKSIMLVAAAAMTFASCQKEIATPETFSTTLTLTAGVEETKTYLDENLNVLWGTKESLTLYVGAGETSKFVSSTATDEFDGDKTAAFTFELTDVASSDSYSLGGIYPASAAINDNKDAAKYKVILPATQNQVDGNYDPSAYIMVLKPEVVTELPEKYTASFRRAVALNKITLTGVQEGISSVEITVPEKKYLAGRRYMNLTTDESGEVYYDQSNKVTVNSSFTGNSIDVWFTSWGVELAEGDELSIKMTSATKTYTRTIAARAEGIKFVEGDLNTLTVNMSSATEETLDNFSGEYLIVNTDLTRAAQAWAGGNNLPEFVLNARDGVVYESEGIENCKMTIEAQADGKYTIKDAKNQYLYAPSSEKNYLNGLKESSENTCWTIVKDGDKYILTSLGNNSRNILRYNNSNQLFSCYASGQNDVTLYKYSDIKVDTTPSISLTNNSDQVTFDATSYEFKYTTKNITGNVAATIKEGATMTNVSASANNGTVTVTFDANEDAVQKTATIVLSYEGAAPKEFVLTQAGKPEEGGEVTTETWSWSGGGKTDFGNDPNVYKTYGLGTDYASSNAPYLIKLDGTGDYFIVNVDGAIQSVSVDVKMLGGSSTSYLEVQGSADGTTFTAVQKFTISGSQNDVLKLATTSLFDTSYRYIKFYFTKGSNVGVGPMSITYVSGNNAGGETPDPEPEPEPEPEPDTPTPSANTYTKYTGNLVEGDYIIVYDNGAMKATVSSNRLQYGTVTVVNDVISDPDASIVWHIAPSGSYWTIYNADATKYAAGNGTKNQAALNASATDEQSLWTASGTATYEFVNKYNKSKSVNSNLRRNTTYGFACYSTSTGGALTLYKKN